MDALNSQQACYHCGEPVPPGVTFLADIAGESRPMCCPGCQAVAQMIHGSGLEAFYRLRTAPSQRPDQDFPAADDDAIYDDPEVLAEFSQTLPDGGMQARLLVTGITCAACTWLIESALERLDGVSHASVNLARHSLLVRWRPGNIGLGEIFRQLRLLGYSAWPWQAARGQELLEAEQRQSLRELAVAGLAMMQVGMFAIALHAGDIQGIAEPYRDLMRGVSLLISTVVVFYAARSFFRNAWNSLRQGTLVMDVPVALAIGLAWSASAYATITGQGQVYFDSVAMFTFFLLLGRYLERRVRQRELLRQTDLQSLLPATAEIRHENRWVMRPLRQLQAGDRLRIREGSVVPADGEVCAGSGRIDEAAFSGEHYPRSVADGDSVIAGTLLASGGVEITVRATGNETRLAGMLDIMELAGSGKPRLVRLADRVAGWFVGALLLLAGAVALAWSHYEPASALWVTLSVLVVSCPCALALATPAALASARAALRRRGLLMGGEDILEGLPGITHVLFDKTGTLTRGNLSVQQVITTGALNIQACQELAASLEQTSTHPVASAFAADSVNRPVERVVSHPGRGISARVDGSDYAIGNPNFIAEFSGCTAPQPDSAGHWIALAERDAVLAWFELTDSVREDAASVVSTLQSAGLRVELLTGDSSDQGPRLAAALGMDDCHSGCEPWQKLEYIRALQAAGARVAMVGDGLNDAPVLAAADCSFAVSGATDLAKARADAIILNGRLSTLLEGFTIAQRCRRIMRGNIAWAITYNAAAVPVAALGLVPPWAAAIGMSASSLLVVLNSLRLH